MEQSKNKKTMLAIIGVAILVIGLVGVTYAFFNYTRTGSANTIRVGRINFVTRQINTINLTNLFPIDPTDSTAMNDSTKVGTLEIEIEGDTDYGEGIEYLVSSVNSNIYTSSGVQVPISLDVTVTDLGTPNANYFTARESKNATIYKKIVGDTLVGDQMLLVGYIKPNTTSGTAEGIDGSITIKAYLDKNKILISDTYDGTESDNMGTTNSKAEGKTVITTSEWNALQSSGVSFQVKIEANQGIWVKGSLEEIMRKKNLNVTTNQPIMDNEASEFVSASTGINFAYSNVSNTNGKGVYMRAGTENNAYPIMYFRGAIDDNNVLFGGQCWKMIRTTDTGGVKMIYNGAQSANKAPLQESDYNILTNTGSMTYNSTEKAWALDITGTVGSSSSPLEISFNVPAGSGYILVANGVTSTSGSMSISVSYPMGGNGTGNGGGNPYGLSQAISATLTSSDVVKVTYYGTGTSESPSTLYVKMVHPDATVGMGCDNNGESTQITVDVNNTPTNEFPFAGTNMERSIAFNGYMRGDVYLTKQNQTSASYLFGSGYTYNNETYTLTNTASGFAATRRYTCFNNTGTCTGNVKYVTYKDNSWYNYMELENGVTFEQALVSMKTNTNDSTAKEMIDSWYEDNMTAYTNKLEDTIWCNDRSSADIDAWGTTNAIVSRYSPYDRIYDNTPSFECQNRNDRFTVNNTNGNSALTYPVGMITSDEIIFATAGGYMKSGSIYWTMSPSLYQNNITAYGFYVSRDGSLNGESNSLSNTFGLRPAVSLKLGTPIVSGTGTVTDPYVIE